MIGDAGNGLLALLALGLFAGVVAAILLGLGFLRSIRRVTEGAQRIGGGELDHRIEAGSGLGELAAAFNEMAEKRQAAEEEILRLNAALEARVEERTRLLQGLVEDLEKSEERYRAVVEQASESIFISDAGTKRILQSNAALQELLGYSAEEFLGMTFYDFIEDSREAIDDNEAHIRADGTHHLGERLYRRKDGGLVPVESSASVIRVGDQEFFCTVAVDMTERKRSQEAVKKSEAGLAEAQRIARVGSWDYDLTNDESTWSEEMYRIFGIPPGTLAPAYRSFLGQVHPEDRRRVRRAVYAASRRGARGEVECRILRPNGEERIVHVRYEAARGDDGKPARLYGTAQDITVRKRAERKERELARYNRSLFEVNLDVLMALDTGGRILDANPAMSEMLGLPRRELLGSNVLGHVRDPELARRCMERCLEQGQVRDFEVEFRGADGRLVPAVCSGTVYHDEGGEVAGILASAHDVTERKEFERQLEHQAFHDPLTGLPNRALFMDRLEHALERARRDDEEGVAVLFMDLDRFKIVNDSLGHGGGDRLLRDVRDRLLSCLRPADTLARVGGDEFCVLLEKVAGYEDAVGVARRVMEVMRSPFVVAGHDAVVSASIGIALGGVGSEVRSRAMGATVTSEGLLRNADLAMYAAKRRGKGDYEIFDPRMNEEARARLKKESDLRRAIERGELKVCYQPRTELLTGRISGFEALVRWESPERGVVVPADFVPLAEETGLIIPIGRWVLREACRQAKAWQDRFPQAPGEPPLSVSVNVSGKQMQAHRGDIVWEVERALNTTGLEPRSLQLEITESVLMEDVPANTATLIRLRSRGVRLAIDDFGTGYSSLSYLERFPLDILKIDRSFVGRLGPDPAGTTFVETMVRLGRSLGLEIVAEGVETPGQLARLTEVGCDEGQGFYFGRPVEAGVAAEMLKTVLR